MKRKGTHSSRRQEHAAEKGQPNFARLDPQVPFLERIDWIRSVAALVAVHREDVERVCPGPNRKTRELLHTETACQRTEWYFNNLRMRHMIAESRLTLLPVGTTSNEALRHQTNNWFRETQKTHKSTHDSQCRLVQSHRRALGSNSFNAGLDGRRMAGLVRRAQGWPNAQ